MDRRKLGNSLDLDDYAALNEKVQAIAAIELDISVYYRQGFLPLYIQSATLKLKLQTGFIRRLQEAWS